MFSIIMPVHNGEAFIKAAIDSVLAQSYYEYELIIINDASTDQSLAMIDAYRAQDERIVLLHSQERGVAAARNVGIAAAKYRYICFLDCDDVWLPHKLEQSFAYFAQGHTMLYAFYTRCNAKNEVLNLVKAPLVIDYEHLLKGNCIGNLTGAYDSTVLGKFYQENIRHEDYRMWLSIVKKAGYGICIPESLAYYRVNAGSLSSNKFKSLLWTWRMYRKHLGYGLWQSLYYWCHAVVRMLNKRF
ncbi:glycosyltransferase family 2 protein [Wohlfahrtiimonas chitiniclastica]|uniref:glycosyltransferase family 2 protein n=1 Tax=Wohlfahrtiimonas chitiniclastica TaxID=400946 RepID=UPI000379FF97|nr:glycosyltransferase family 2 protein [Wohlfahrtiimonas chitiniclastica]